MFMQEYVQDTFAFCLCGEEPANQKEARRFIKLRRIMRYRNGLGEVLQEGHTCCSCIIM